MNSVVLLASGLFAFYLGYRFYSKFLGEQIFDLSDESIPMPSKLYEDGMDFIPTNKHILFGHHFTSIAGAAPIIGPCIAAFWGWLPALIWIVFGTIFMGAAHDFGALVTSAREKGKSVADIASKAVSNRARIMFLVFIILLIWLVLAVFSMAIADLFVSVPTSVLPVNIQIIIAIAMGFLVLKKKKNTLIPSLISIFLLYFFIWVGSFTPINLSSFLNIENSIDFWILALFIYSAIASLLPVWVLLQPRDYINSHQLFIGLGLLFLGILIARPMVDAPMIRAVSEPGSPSLFPLIFVTIACGAISGFHGLVGSGTSSKQLEYIQDSRLVGYGGMIGEGALALVSTICAVAGISLVSQANLPSIGHVADLNWSIYYDTWAHASNNKAAAFVLGGGAFLQSLGISPVLANTLIAVLVISFAATTLDTATRIQRFILNEFGVATNLKFLSNKYIATFIAVVPSMFLAFYNISDPNSGDIRQAGWVLWPIFGASNQMLAALVLMVLTLYYFQKNKPVLPLLVPMIIIMLITFMALITNAINFYSINNFLFGLSILLIGLIIWMIYEGFIKLLEIKRKS